MRAAWRWFPDAGRPSFRPHRISLRLPARLLRLHLKGGVIRHLLGARASRPHPVPTDASSPARESTGTLLNYWNNLFPASEPWLAENRQPTLRQTRLSGPGPRHTQSHFTETSPSRQIRSVSGSTRPVFSAIQQRPRFFPGHLALSPQRRGNPCGCPVVRGGQETEAGKQGKDSWRQKRACQGILFKVWFRRC